MLLVGRGGLRPTEQSTAGGQSVAGSAVRGRRALGPPHSCRPCRSCCPVASGRSGARQALVRGRRSALHPVIGAGQPGAGALGWSARPTERG
eukprot:4016396-Lingulodinium_polyedra.AAC.1